MASDDTVNIKIAAEIGDLESQFGNASQSVSRLAAQVQKLNGEAFSELATSFKQGAIDADEFIDGLRHVQSESSKTAAAVRLNALMNSEASAASEGLTVATAGVTREIVVLGRELSAGRISNMPGSFALLAQRMNLLSPAGILAAAGIAAVGYAAYEVVAASERMDKALNDVSITMNAVGKAGEYDETFTRGLIVGLRQAADVSSETANRIVREFESMRNVGQDDIEQLTHLVRNYATATGESTDRAAKDMQRLFGPEAYGAIKQLDEQFNLLTTAQREQAQAAHETGDEITLTRIAMDALNELAKRVPDESLTPMAKAWNDFKKSLGGVNIEAAKTRDALLAEAAALDEVGNAEARAEAQRKRSEAGSYSSSARNIAEGSTRPKMDQPTAPDPAAEARRAAAEAENRLHQQRTDLVKQLNDGYEHSGTLKAQELALDQKINEAQRARQAALALGDSASASKASDEIDHYNREKGNMKERGVPREKKEKPDHSDDQFAALLASEAEKADRDQQKQGEERIADTEKVALAQMKTRQDEAKGETDALIRMAAEEHSIRLQALQDSEALYAQHGDDTGAAKARAEQLVEQERYNQQVVTLNRQAAQDTQRQWEQSFAPITQAFKGTITGMIQGTQTLSQAVNRIGQNIVSEMVNNVIKKTVDSWVAGEVTKTAATNIGASARAASEMVGTSASLAQNIATTEKQQQTDAVGVFSSVFNYLAPELGPFAAIPAGIAFAAVEALSLPSAAGGWQVPSDQMAMVHENEMILPARYTRGLNNMVDSYANGQGGGGNTYNITHNIHAAPGMDVNQISAAVSKNLQKQLRLSPSLAR